MYVTFGQLRCRVRERISDRRECGSGQPERDGLGMKRTDEACAALERVKFGCVARQTVR